MRTAGKVLGTAGPSLPDGATAWPFCRVLQMSLVMIVNRTQHSYYKRLDIVSWMQYYSYLTQ